MGQQSEVAFTAFVDEYGDGLARFARLLTASPHDAEDLLQAALLKVFRRWSNAAPAPVAYTKTTLVNLAKDGYRSRSLNDLPVAELPHNDSAPDIAIAIAAQAQIEHLLAGLPPRQRVTVVLRVLDGHSTDETAALMSCSVGTVKSNLARGLERLRESIESSAARTPTTEVRS